MKRSGAALTDPLLVDVRQLSSGEILIELVLE